MSINKPTIEEHIKYIGTPCTWGTHIEILAAATYYKLPIYFVSRKNDESVFKWKPLRADHMNYPVLTDENEFLLHTEAMKWCIIVPIIIQLSALTQRIEPVVTSEEMNTVINL